MPRVSMGQRKGHIPVIPRSKDVQQVGRGLRLVSEIRKLRLRDPSGLPALHSQQEA